MYKMVEGSSGEARSFAITVGLQEGYGSTGKTHNMEEVVSLIESYLKKLAVDGKPFLTGIITSGTVVYAWPEGTGKAEGGHEPQVVFSGEVTPLYLSSLSDKEVEGFLNDLASFLGEKLGQTRIYLRYKVKAWILQWEGSKTPTGEKIEEKIESKNIRIVRHYRNYDVGNPGFNVKIWVYDGEKEIGYASYPNVHSPVAEGIFRSLNSHWCDALEKLLFSISGAKPWTPNIEGKMSKNEFNKFLDKFK